MPRTNVNWFLMRAALDVWREKQRESNPLEKFFADQAQQDSRDFSAMMYRRTGTWIDYGLFEEA